MPPTRWLALALIFASIPLTTACGQGECPAAGTPISLDGPQVQPEWAAGCIDARWTSGVQPRDASWTIELRREASPNELNLAATSEGVSVIWGSELIVVDGEGHEQASRGVGGFVDWTNLAVTSDGRTVIGGQSGNTPEYRVYDLGGKQVWLRLLDIDNPAINQPSLTIAADGALWVGLLRFSADFSQIDLVVEQWSVTGDELSETVLADVENIAFARDGAGRFAVLSNAIELFAADGSPLASVDFGGDWRPFHLVGAEDGFVVGGRDDYLPSLARIDGQGTVVWQRTLDSHADDGDARSSITSVAALPDGGVVAVGTEELITTRWPDSPLVWTTQPFVAAFDDEGEPTWGERLAVAGAGESVSVGPGGEVYVGGTAQASKPSEYGQADTIVWVRRYDP